MTQGIVLLQKVTSTRTLLVVLTWYPHEELVHKTWVIISVLLSFVG